VFLNALGNTVTTKYLLNYKQIILFSFLYAFYENSVTIKRRKREKNDKEYCNIVKCFFNFGSGKLLLVL
jgi:hypothetical protein